MTFTINITFLYYWIIAIVFETIYCYFIFKTGWNKAKQNETFTIIVNSLKELASFKLLWKSVFNPVTYIIVYLILCLVAPILFPYSLFKIIRKLFGKTKLEKQAEKETESYEASQERSEDFMENEGVYSEENPISPYPLEKIERNHEEYKTGQMISGQLHNDPYTQEKYWTLYETNTRMPFRVVNSQNEILTEKVGHINNMMFNYDSQIYKARIISERTVEVILD